MTEFFPFIVAGITSGSVYGLAATGLVLTYKTSGIFNFAHGATAAAAAYVFYELRVVRDLPWPVAGFVTVFLFAPLMGLVLELVARRVSHTDTANRIVATIGLLLAIQGYTAWQYGSVPLDFPTYLPTDTFRIGDINVGYDQLIIVLISIACVAGLFLFFRSTRLGLEMQAVVDRPDLLDLTGSDPVVVRRAAWFIGSAFAAMSGILVAQTLGLLDAIFLTLLVVQAFGAAAVGRFTNIVVTFIAAIGIGIAGELIKKYVPDYPSIIGLPPSLPFIVLFGALLFSPAGRFREQERRRRPHRALVLPVAARAGLTVAAVVVVLLIPTIVDTRLPVYTNGAIYVTLFVSLSLLVRLSGQVSLCQISFAAIGASTFSHLTDGAGVPWGVAFVLAGLVVVPVGALLAIPAIRLSGLYLALATFGFAVLLERFAFGTFIMFGAVGNRRAPKPEVFNLDGDRGFFYLCAGVAALSIVVVVLISRARLGRLLRSLADSPLALATHGADVNVTRVLVFCISSFLAGISGALLISQIGTASASSFDFFTSLLLLATLTISGRSLVVAPIIAAVALKVIPAYITNPDLSALLQLYFGLGALAVCCFGPAFSDWLTRAAPATAWRRRASPVQERPRYPALEEAPA